MTDPMLDTGGRASPEQEVLAFLKATADDQLAFARRLIATPSPTPLVHGLWLSRYYSPC